MKELETRKCGEGNVPVFADKEDAENPMDREEVKSAVNAYKTGEDASSNSQVGLRGVKDRSRTNNSLAKTIA